MNVIKNRILHSQVPPFIPQCIHQKNGEKSFALCKLLWRALARDCSVMMSSKLDDIFIPTSNIKKLLKLLKWNFKHFMEIPHCARWKVNLKFFVNCEKKKKLHKAFPLLGFNANIHQELSMKSFFSMNSDRILMNAIFLKEFSALKARKGSLNCIQNLVNLRPRLLFYGCFYRPKKIIENLQIQSIKFSNNINISDFMRKISYHLKILSFIRCLRDKLRKKQQFLSYHGIRQHSTKERTWISSLLSLSP